MFIRTLSVLSAAALCVIGFTSDPHGRTLAAGEMAVLAGGGPLVDEDPFGPVEEEDVMEPGYCCGSADHCGSRDGATTGDCPSDESDYCTGTDEDGNCDEWRAGQWRDVLEEGEFSACRGTGKDGDKCKSPQETKCKTTMTCFWSDDTSMPVAGEVTTIKGGTCGDSTVCPPPPMNPNNPGNPLEPEEGEDPFDPFAP